MRLGLWDAQAPSNKAARMAGVCDLNPRVIGGEVNVSTDSNFIEFTIGVELQVLSCNHMPHKRGASMAARGGWGCDALVRASS